MTPTEFEGQNIVIAKDQPQYIPLPALVSDGQVITCWELTDEDLEELSRTRRIWASQLTFGRPLQPQRLSVTRPFDLVEELQDRRILDVLQRLHSLERESYREAAISVAEIRDGFESFLRGGPDDGRTLVEWLDYLEAIIERRR